MASLIPYLCVHNTRAAIRWYHDAFGATVIGDPIEMCDGTIGSAELALFGARVLLSDPSAEAYAAPADPGRASTVKIHMAVPDCDACVARCRRVGAVIEREPTDSRYGRGAEVLDPFGHRWIIVETVAPAAGGFADPVEARAASESQTASDKHRPAPSGRRKENGRGQNGRGQNGRGQNGRGADEPLSDNAGWRTAKPMPTPYPLPKPPLASSAVNG